MWACLPTSSIHPLVKMDLKATASLYTMKSAQLALFIACLLWLLHVHRSGEGRGFHIKVILLSAWWLVLWLCNSAYRAPGLGSPNRNELRIRVAHITQQPGS